MRNIPARSTRLKLAAAALLAAAAPALAQELSLRAAVFVPVQTAFGELCGKFVNQVNATARGTLQIRLVGGPEAVPSFEQANAVRTGVLDMACVPAAFYASVVPEADAQVLATIPTREQRKSGAYAALQKIHTDRMGVHLLTTYGDGVKFHIYTNKPVNSLADFKGMKLRTTPSYTPFFQALGAVPVNTAPGEVATALERGVVDGYGWPLIGIFDLGWGKHTRYRVDPGFYTVITNLIVNGKRWQSLSPAQRAALEQTASWFDDETLKWASEKNAAEAKRQAEAGIQVTRLNPDYVKLAYDTYWAELAKRAPEPIRMLRPLLDR